jgi:tRNA dimethylallyltransferase
VSGRLVSSQALIAVIGPTAAGKSALALRLADELAGEVVCCDALQIRAGLPILTAKPTAAELLQAPHHLIGVLPIDQPGTAAQYAELADAAIAQIHGRGRRAIVCGGTGLYLRALRDGLFPGPAGDPALRRELRAQAAADGLPVLHARLQAVDPQAAARIAPADYVRIERALEVFQLTGRPITAWQDDSQRERRSGPRYRVLLVGVDPGPELLRVRIERRAQAMLAAGVIREVEAALAEHGPLRYPPLGYDQVRRHLDGSLTLPDLITELSQKTAQYARRQRTWFRGDLAKKAPGPAPAPGDETYGGNFPAPRWLKSADSPSAELDAVIAELKAAALAG